MEQQHRLKQFSFEKQEQEHVKLGEKLRQKKDITNQAITNNDISITLFQQVKKTRESLSTYSANAAFMHFGFDLHLDQHSPMGNFMI